MRTREAVLTTAVLTGLLGLVAPAAQAAPAGGSYAEHVRSCAQSMHFSGTHDPGRHRGASGWDGLPCH